MNNRELSDIFTLIADLLEIKGDVVYKVLAYRRAAENILNLGRDVNEVCRDGSLENVPGVGTAIALKAEELLSTGRLKFLEDLKTEVPETLVEMMQVHDIGPKKVRLFWKQGGITTLDELTSVAENGALRKLPGIGKKSESMIIAGIAALARRTGRCTMGVVWPVAQELLAFLRDVPGVHVVEVAGSLRRMKATVGDLDLLAAVMNSTPVMEAFIRHPYVAQVLSHGTTKSSVEFESGLRVQLWTHPVERFGTALQYATGSQDHNVRLRELALTRGLSLSEHALTRSDGSAILCANEHEVYHALGLPYIPPELREDTGEVQAALDDRLPELLEHSQIRSELHAHTTWSDGTASIETMAREAYGRGLNVLAITDHTYGLGVANGLTVGRLRQQRKEIELVQRKLGDSIQLLLGAEVEIRADGTLDFDNDVLEELDVVIAALHSGLRQPRAQITERLLRVCRNPHVDIIAHPGGRRMPDRESADIDMDAILAVAAESGVALEINANPARLDLEYVYARRAVRMGVCLAVNCDAHKPEHFDLLRFGVATARRGWVGPENVINAWEPERLLHWLSNKNGSG